jgi:hypothetical protein
MRITTYAVLELESFSFTGTQFTQILVGLSQLTYIDLGNNQLNGSILTPLRLSQLTELYLYLNELSGSIPHSNTGGLTN